MELKELCKVVVEKQGSDLHLCTGLPPSIRLNGELNFINDKSLTKEDIENMLSGFLSPGKNRITENEELDLAVEIPDMARFRCNIYHDRNGICAALRLIPEKIKSIEELGLPLVVRQISSLQKGLVLVTGVTGSGKSTTLAAVIDAVNSERKEHIITIEDPIEYIHKNKKSIINQRELESHTKSFAVALKAALREDPNVILVGELRDLETISMAVTAAETGHLVLATLHSSNAVDAINRIIDVFPAHQQDQIRVQLAENLFMVISQVLLPSVDGKTRYLACEVMIANPAIKNLIRDKQTYQIRNTITLSSKDGMQTIDQSLKLLVDSGKVSNESALPWAVEKAKI